LRNRNSRHGSEDSQNDPKDKEMDTGKEKEKEAGRDSDKTSSEDRGETWTLSKIGTEVHHNLIRQHYGRKICHV